MGDTAETSLRYSTELLEVLPSIVCEDMWLISISRNANNKCNCEKCGFLHISHQFSEKNTISHILIYVMQAKIGS